jgi:hypothetical protein
MCERGEGEREMWPLGPARLREGEREVRDETLSASFIHDYGNGPSGLVWASGQFFETIRKMPTSENGFMEADVLRQLPSKMEDRLRKSILGDRLRKLIL